jgi:hypothetical protein
MKGEGFVIFLRGMVAARVLFTYAATCFCTEQYFVSKDCVKEHWVSAFCSVDICCAVLGCS